MPWYSEEQIEEVRSRSDIVQIIGRYVSLKRSGSGYMGLCPFHNEKTPSFHVDPSRQIYKCFGCGVGGNVLTFLMEYESLSFPEALQMLAEQTGVALTAREMTADERSREGERQLLLEIHKKAAAYYYHLLKSPAGALGYDYLKKRELSDEMILHFGLGYAGQGMGMLYRYLKQEGYEDRILKETGLFTMKEQGVYDKFFNRVMFPIMDINNRVIGFGGRVMGDAKPKYLNSPETKIFDKSKNLFGLNYAKRGRHEHFILCEGYMDVIAMHQAGFTNAVASLGTSFTDGQAGILKRYTNEVLLTYDSDQAGIKAALRAIPILRKVGIVARIIHMDPYKDPDEFIKAMGRDAFQERIDQAQNSFFFEVDVLKKGLSFSDPEQKTRFMHEVAKKLLDFEDKIRRDNYLEAVCAEYGINSGDLKQLVLEYSNRMPNGYREALEQRQAVRKKENSYRQRQGEGIEYSYRLYLTWLTREPGLYKEAVKWISPEDFDAGIYRRAAQELYDQLDKGEVEPARIIGHFQDVEEQKLVANIFQTEFGSAMEPGEKKKALTDLILKIKEDSLDKKAAGIQDLKELQNLVQQKKSLQSAVKLHIS